jgi:hypothetical protein
MNTHIYETADGYSVADGGGWLPGIYATSDAAALAAEVAKGHYSELAQLAHYSVRGVGDAYRPITVDDLAEITDPGSATVHPDAPGDR